MIDTLSKIEEIWKDIPGWEGSYQVSTLGRIKSVKRYVAYKSVNGKSVVGTVPERIIKLFKSRAFKSWYVQVHLCKDRKINHKYLHRLMAEAFLPNPKKYKEVNHIDGNSENNIIYNLEWCTRSQNIQHSYNIGIRKSHGIKGKLNKKSKPILQYDKNGNFLREWENGSQIQEVLGFSRSAIFSCVSGHTKTSSGYKWKYK